MQKSEHYDDANVLPYFKKFARISPNKGKSYVSQNILFVQMSSILFTILQNGLGEAVLMSTRNILFTGEFMKLAFFTQLICSTDCCRSRYNGKMLNR